MNKGRVEINQEVCKGCGLCVSVCPTGILQLSPDEMNSKGYSFSTCIDQTRCIACVSCAMVCPDLAIRVYKHQKEETA